MGATGLTVVAVENKRVGSEFGGGARPGDHDRASVWGRLRRRHSAGTASTTVDLAALVKELGIRLGHLALGDGVVKGGALWDVARQHAILEGVVLLCKKTARLLLDVIGFGKGTVREAVVLV